MDFMTSEDFLADLSAAKPDDGFSVSEDLVSLWWGNFEYRICMSTIQRPEDLLWWLVHIGYKNWPQQTPRATGEMVKAVAQQKGWKVNQPVPHPNEAPPAFLVTAGERAKMTPALRYQVIKRDGYRCRACGVSVSEGARLHVDHIIAVANGGKTKPENLQTLCSCCNAGKGAS